MMKEKGPHYPQYSYDIIRKHSLMISSDIKEYNKVGDTKTPSLHSIPFNFKVKNGDIMSTGQYMNHQSFTISKTVEKIFPQHKNRTKGYYS